MTTDSTRVAKIRNFNGIQALRGFAAAIVVVHHATRAWSAYTFHNSEAHGWSNGAGGVDIFFVISGFVMAISTPAKQLGDHPARSFLERRLIRVAPLYWLVTAVVLLKESLARVLPQLASSSGHAQITFPYLLSTLLFFPYRDSLGFIRPVLGVGWTLSFEMFFYLLFALALALRISVVGMLTPLLILLAGIGVFRTDSRPAVTVLLSPILLEFLGGLLLGEAVKRGTRLNVPLSTILGLAGMAVLLFGPSSELPNLRIFSWGIPAFLIVLSVVALEERFGKRWPRWTLVLGDASYSLYLSHLLVLPYVLGVLAHLHLLTTSRLSEVVTVAICVGICVFVSLLMYRLIEKPIGDTLRRAMSTKKAPLTQESQVAR